MARYHHDVYAISRRPNYVVLFDSQREILESQRLEPRADLRGAMTAAISRFVGEGWTIEGTPKFGFVFLNRGAVRCLLMLTERDPFDTSPQSFSPFK
jgi:hypothetical protein